MAQYLVGLDGGTTGCKTCIFDLDGKLVGSDYREYPSYYPEPGWVEQTTEDLLPNFYDSIKTAINKSGIFTCIFNLWSLPAIAEEWKSAVLISGLLYGSGTSCCRLWKFAGGTSKCNRRHKRSVKKKKSRKQKKA